MTGRNIGDLLNAAGVSWGWFQGGFDLTITNAGRQTGCAAHDAFPDRAQDVAATTSRITSRSSTTRSTANPSTTRARRRRGDRPRRATRPTTSTTCATSSPRCEPGNFPAVSFLKAPAFQDGHAGYSDPLDEQTFVVAGGQLPASRRRSGATPR